MSLSIGTRIRLSADDLALAQRIAETRMRNARMLNCDGALPREEHGSMMKKNYRGALGELAFTRLLSLDTTLLLDDAPNDALIDRGDCLLASGESVDVKTVSCLGSADSSRGALFVQPWKRVNPADIYARMSLRLLTDTSAELTFDGAIAGSDAFSLLFSPYGHCVPRGARLDDMWTFYRICYRVPPLFLGGLPDPTTSAPLRVPQTHAELMALPPEARSWLTEEGLVCVGRRLDAMIDEPVLTYREWIGMLRQRGLQPLWPENE